MDLATLIGLGVGTLVILLVMLMSGSLMMYYDTLSLIIVIGGALCGVLIRWPLPLYISGLMGALQAIQDNVPDPGELINELVELAQTARKGSILALEKVEISNSFLEKAVKLMVDGQDVRIINEIIEIDIMAVKQANTAMRGVYEDLGEAAPAFGMIGTVIGLIVIMANLDDPSAIGPGLAVALVTTLYGSLIANLVFLPIAKKIQYRGTSQVLNLRIIKDGVNSILAGENPRTMREKLESFLGEGGGSSDAEAA